MGALGVMLPRRWSKPFCSPKIWWSCEVLGGVKSSFILKGFWAWYVLILPYYFFIFYFLFDIILIPTFLFQGCSKYIQARGDDQLPLSATGWGEEKEGYCCANLGHC